jgi:hypothetical protein
MKTLKEIDTEHGKLAREFVETLDEVLNIYINVFDHISVSGYKNGRVIYREFKPWD